MNARRLVPSVFAVVLGVLLFATAPARAAEEYVFSTSFGGGSLGVAVNQLTGRVYAAVEGDGVDVFEPSGAPAATPQLTGTSFGFPFGVAVDNSTQPSQGDIYVSDFSAGAVDQFDPAGSATAIRVTEASIPVADRGKNGTFEPRGVAVNSSGDLYVVDSSAGTVDEFSSTGVFIAQVGSAAQIEGAQLIAINSANDLYVATDGGIVEFDASGHCVNNCIPLFTSGHVGLAVNGAGDLFVGEESQVSEYSTSNSLLRQLGLPSSQPPFPGLGGSFGVAVNDKTRAVYVTGDPTTDAVDLFRIQLVQTEAASSVGETGVTLNGSVNPEGEKLTECYFEYGPGSSFGEAYGQSKPCEQTPEGTSFVPVSAQLTGLQPHTSYHYRLVTNGPEGLAYGFDKSFYTFSRPAVEDESSTNIGPTTATVSAQVNPGGSLSAYYVEYGTSTAYGSSTPPQSVGAGEQGAGVLVQLSSLQPETTYHFRFVASNQLGVEYGGDLSLTTPLASSTATLGLPDGRGFEMVSPVDNADGNVYEPVPQNHGTFGSGESTSLPMRASADGAAVEYVADPPATGGDGSVGNGSGNEYVARRTLGGGWSAVDLETPGLEKAPFEASLPDELVNAGTSAVPAGSVSLSGSGGGLFESVGGRSVPVNVLPDGDMASRAEFGGGGLSHVISADGSRIYWTDQEEGPDKGDLFVRENGMTTVQVNATQGPGPSGGGRFWMASSDGSRVFFTDCSQLTAQSTAVFTDGCERENMDGKNGADNEVVGNDLYEYGVDTSQLVDLTVDHNAGDLLSADVQGVVGASEDGSYLYFIAGGVLSANENAEKERAQLQTCNPGVGGAEGTLCNLYVIHEGVTTFIAALTSQDLYGFNSHDLDTSLAGRSAQVAPNGQGLVFISERNLTGYDDNGTDEVYVYNADTGGLSCASCDPTGAPPAAGGGGSLPTSFSPLFTRRWISEDGSRVFFQSSEPLVAQDTNGVQDVYEWERDGVGSCGNVNGCVYLLSGGASSAPSFFLDASASGDDVFIISRAQLTAQDQGETYEVYDARVGATQPPAEQACTGTGCQGLPAAPPLFATPSSATFNGVGNFLPPAPAVKVAKKAVKCANGKKLSHGKCIKPKKKKKKAKRASNYRRATR